MRVRKKARARKQSDGGEGAEKPAVPSAAENSPKESGVTRFSISPLFFLLAAFMLFTGFGFELVYHFAALVIHEFAHAEAARRRGYVLSRLTLTPYGASLTGAFEGVKISDEIVIALVGPAVNLIVAVAFVAVWWLAPVTFAFSETFVFANLFTAAFNLIPVYPLDGGRVLLAALSSRFKRQSVYKILRIAGLIAAAVFAAAFFCTFYFAANLSLALIAVFFFISTVFPDKNSAYRRLYSMAYRSDKLKKGLAVKEVMIHREATLLSLMRMLNANYFYRFKIVDGNFETVGEITELELEELAVKFGGNFSVGTVLAGRLSRKP